MSSATSGDSSVAHIPIAKSSSALAETPWVRGPDAAAPLALRATEVQPLFVCLMTMYEATRSTVVMTTASAPKGNSGTAVCAGVEVVLEVALEVETVVGPARTMTAPFMKVCMVQW